MLVAKPKPLVTFNRSNYPAATPEIISLLKVGKKVAAIKLIRELGGKEVAQWDERGEPLHYQYKIELNEAKQVIEWELENTPGLGNRATLRELTAIEQMRLNQDAHDTITETMQDLSRRHRVTQDVVLALLIQAASLHNIGRL